MAAGNCSVEAIVIENGKNVKGTLTLFIDEYSFGGKRTAINWEKAVCKDGMVSVKAFLRSVEKPSITFTESGVSSPQFVFEQAQFNTVKAAIKDFVASIKSEREAKEAEARRIEEEAKRKEAEKQRQIDEEKRIREEAKRKADEEYRLKKEAEQRQKAEAERREREAFTRKMEEKKARISKEVENCKYNPKQEMVTLSAIAVKAGTYFLDNPYRILGVSCLASNEEANTALDKLKKLARLKALESYRSAFDFNGLDKPARDLSVAQNALTLLKDKSNRWFWFSESDACAAWQSGKYRMELAKDGLEYGTYDLFLANYMYAVLCDPNFSVPETWKRVLNFYCFICKQSSGELLLSRYTDKERAGVDKTELVNSFKNTILKPILLLCERDDLDAVLRLHKCIRECDNSLLDTLSRNVVGKLVSWFTDKEAAMFSYMRELDSEDTISDSKGKEIRERGDAYCKVVEPVFELVLKDFRGDPVRYDMIKESYRHTTYQLMYELNKCSDKSNAIYFANKCYSYCSSDDKKRINNTFGEANIKAIDWNTPHTAWDAKGDDYYFGRGCPVDYTQALYWYHKAEEAGNMHSKNSIGLCYQKGTGVPQDDSMAASWFEKAAEAGSPAGAYNLAECYFTGTGVKQSIDKAIKYWGEAAKLGHPSAEQRKNEEFGKVQARRRAHRARNHICHDIGFQMTTGPNLVAEVTLNQAAYVYLVNAQGYQNYLNGGDFSYHGGYASQSPHRVRIPTSNRWYVIVDNGDEPITGIISSVKVKNA